MKGKPEANKCSSCGGPLILMETQALGKCLECLKKEKEANVLSQSKPTEAKTDLTKQELMRIFEEQIDLKTAEIQRLEGENKKLRKDNADWELLYGEAMVEGGKISKERIEAITSAETLENLAELEHEQWSEWIKYMESLKVIVDVPIREMWLKLACLPYRRLTEKGKESDRKFARKVLGVLLQPKVEKCEFLGTNEWGPTSVCNHPKGDGFCSESNCLKEKVEPKSEAICVNPHEKVYRGCSEKCKYFANCQAKGEV